MLLQQVSICWPHVFLPSYPWVKDPNNLPDDYQTTLATLERTKERLKKDLKWAKTYHSQMSESSSTYVFHSGNERSEWSSILHLAPALVNPRSHSTPVRIVFNSSRMHKGLSLNACLAEGPDNYLNSLIGILLRWREERVSLIADIKIFNSVHLKILEQHCHRFLWRDLQHHQTPDVYMIQLQLSAVRLCTKLQSCFKKTAHQPQTS